MVKLSNLRSLLIAESSKVMLQDSFKSGLYPELFKIFNSLFGNTKICFCDELKVYNDKEIDNFKSFSHKHKFKRSIINRFLRFAELFVGRNLYFEKYRYHNLLKNINSEFDVIIVITSTSNSGVLGYLISKKLGLPYIILEHKTHYQRGLIKFWQKRLIKFIQKSAKVVAPVSEPLETCLKKFNPDINTQVIHNPIGGEMFEKPSSEITAKLSNFTNGNFCFGAWTTWRKIKRLDILLDAFSNLRSSSNKTYKLVVGGSSVDKETENRMKQDPDILFLGSLVRKDVHALSAFIDCCIVCSDHETFGLPIAEAMAQGKPVIATNSGGVEGLINNSLGLVIKRNDLVSLIDAMKFMSEKKNYSREEITKFAKNQFRSDAIKKKWSILLSSILAP